MSEMNKKDSIPEDALYDHEDGLNAEELSKTMVMETLTDASEEKIVVEPGKKKTLKKEISAAREIFEFFRDLMLCMAAVLILTNYIARPVQVKGNSMYPTLHDSALGFSNILGFKTKGIERFDVVIIYLDQKEEYLVKRCVGLPGETIAYYDGQLYVNGEAVAEEFLDPEYIAECERTGTIFMNDVQEITLGEDEYYCLGDNRPHSSDSRYYGPFHIDKISSKGIFVFWPFSQFGGKAW